jgi:hypothetical protein
MRESGAIENRRQKAVDRKKKEKLSCMLLPAFYFFLLSACCLLPTDCNRRDHIEEIAFLSIGLVEALADSFSFCGSSPSHLRIYVGMAPGL